MQSKVEDHVASKTVNETKAMVPEQKNTLKEVWNKSNLTWNPGNMTLTATSGNKKAICKGKDLVPEIFHKQLFEKRKSVVARVEVEPIGNAFKIVRIKQDT
jgi:hypothetical protein